VLEGAHELENGYLGGGMLAATFLVMAFAYRQFRMPGIAAILDNEIAATITGWLMTAALAASLTVFAGNVYITDQYSTIVSSVLAAGALLVLILVIARTRTEPMTSKAEPYNPAPFTPETPAANTNKPAPARRARRKAA
jgi:hypothetical protein